MRFAPWNWLRNAIWTRTRFSWTFVVLAVTGTAALLWFDWYWRTHDTSFANLF